MNFLFSPAFAADETTSTTAPATAPYDLSAEKMMKDNIMLLVLIFAIIYFIVIMPQQKRVKQHNAMIKTLQKGSKVITGGGIIGTIIKFEGDDIIIVEIAQGVRVRVEKSSITEVAGDNVASGAIANDN